MLISVRHDGLAQILLVVLVMNKTFTVIRRKTFGISMFLSLILGSGCNLDSHIETNASGADVQTDTLRRVKAECHAEPNPLVRKQAWTLRAAGLGRYRDVRVDVQAAGQAFSWTTQADRSGHLHEAGAQTLQNLGPVTVHITHVQPKKETRLATCQTHVIDSSDTTPPTVLMTSPSSDITLTEPATIALRASATDEVGIREVAFFLDDILVFTDTVAPFEASWRFGSSANGAHRLRAEAIDVAGNRGVSPSITVKVAIEIDTAPPSVSILSPISGITFNESQTVSISVNASDNIGVTKIELYRNDILVGTSASSAYTFPWHFDAAHNGTHVWSARAYDKAGHRAMSDDVSVTVAIDNPTGEDKLPPAIYISSPVSGQEIQTYGRIKIHTYAYDNSAPEKSINAGVREVQFYHNDVHVATDVEYPFAHEWLASQAQNGVHTWTVVAVDEAGNTASSSASYRVSIDADIDNTPPEPNVKQPKDGTLFTEAGKISVKLYPYDNVKLGKVELYKDGALIDSSTSFLPRYDNLKNFYIPYDASDNGEHVIGLKVYDEAGNVALFESKIEINIGGPDDEPPVASINNIEQGAIFTRPATITVQIGSDDNIGVENEELYLDGQLVSTSLTFDASQNGVHELVARVFDGAGNYSDSKPILFSVAIDANDDTVPPTVQMRYPADQAVIDESFFSDTVPYIEFEADLDDNVSIDSVRFYVDDGKESIPWGEAWPIDFTKNGTHTVYATVRDKAGNETTSAANTFTVNVAPNYRAPYVGHLVSNEFTLSLGPASSSSDADNRMTTFEDLTGLVYVDWGTSEDKKYLYLKNNSGDDAHIHLPGIGGEDRIAKARYILTSRNELWLFSGAQPAAFGPGAPANIRQYRLSGSPIPDTAELVFSRSHGGDRTEAKDIIQLKSGALVAAWYRHKDDAFAEDAFWADLHMVYRSPTGVWVDLPPIRIESYRFHLNSLVLQQHPKDGSLWVFSKPDSAENISALHFTETNDGLRFDWLDNEFLLADKHGGHGPEGEIPTLYAVPDPNTQTILLGYQNQNRKIVLMGKIFKWAYISLVNVHADGNKDFTLLPQKTERVHGLRGIGVKDGDYYVIYNQIDLSRRTDYRDVHFSLFSQGQWAPPRFIGRSEKDPQNVMFDPETLQVGLRWRNNFDLRLYKLP